MEELDRREAGGWRGRARDLVATRWTRIAMLVRRQTRGKNPFFVVVIEVVVVVVVMVIAVWWRRGGEGEIGDNSSGGREGERERGREEFTTNKEEACADQRKQRHSVFYIA